MGQGEKAVRCSRCGSSALRVEGEDIWVCINAACRAAFARGQLEVELNLLCSVGTYVRLKDGPDGWIDRAWFGFNGELVYSLSVDAVKFPGLAGASTDFLPAEIAEVIRHDPERELVSIERWGHGYDARVRYRGRRGKKPQDPL